MRPIKLVMSAFGPYAQREEIDFRLLGESGVYLITGVTGAGKTTVFDGISYALYGEPSGKNRKDSMLRSTYADENTPTFVELTFEYRDIEYTVKRAPKQERPSKKGGGMTTENAYSELICPNKTITGREVNAKIEEILGISRDQFAQIAMIAQGTFLELLLAKTNERMEILRKIFNTEKYESLEKLLSFEEKKLKGEIDDLRKNFDIYTSEIQVSSNSLYSEEMTKANDKILKTDEIIDLCGHILAEDENEKVVLDKNLELIEGELEQVLKALDDAKKYNQLTKELENNKNQLAHAKERVDFFKKQLEDCADKESEISEIDKDIASIEDKIDDYDTLDKSVGQMALLQSETKSLSEKNDADNRRIAQYNERIKGFEEENGKFENTEINIEKLTAQKNEKATKKEQLKSVLLELQNIAKANQEYLDAREQYLKSAEIESRSTQTYNLLNRAYLDDQAGILAENVEDGKPCPVCGSLHHPSLAKKSPNAPTFEKVEKAKRNMEEARKKSSDLSSIAHALLGKVQGLKSSLEGKIIDLFGDIPFDSVFEKTQNAIDKVDAELEILSKKIAEENVNAQRKQQIMEQLPRLKELQKKLEESINDNLRKIEVNKTKFESEEKNALLLKSKLKFESKDKATEVMSSLVKKKDELRAQIKQAQKNYEDETSRYLKLDGKISEQQKQLAEFSGCQNVEEQAQRRQELLEEKTEIQTLQKQNHSRIQTNKRMQVNLIASSKDLLQAEKKFAWLSSLSRTMNGRVNEKSKIHLETYIQISYFDRILWRANKKLSVMSSGQYELKRKKAGVGANSGLELNVIDHYNGTEREVDSLSGGESFKASLCLALGLSEEIECSSGGVKLDTMFVDEGFGSLDENSLSLAMDALIGLGESNRLVGIISHVGALKERIDKQIVITKENGGASHAQIEIK